MYFPEVDPENIPHDEVVNDLDEEEEEDWLVVDWNGDSFCEPCWMYGWSSGHDPNYCGRAWRSYWNDCALIDYPT